MQLGLIYAQARGGVIGAGGTLPWHLPEDLAHFKAITRGHPVVMGRKTWDSLPPRFRPLPGRRNLVVTRQAEWRAAGAEHAGSLQEALALCEPAPEAWVIGGAELFALALPLAQVIELTEIDASFQGDTFAPPLGPEWTVSRREAHTAASGLGYTFLTLRRSAST